MSNKVFNSLSLCLFLDAGNEIKKELKKFELNLNEMSDFSVANRLWEIIEENCSTVL